MLFTSQTPRKNGALFKGKGLAQIVRKHNRNHGLATIQRSINSGFEFLCIDIRNALLNGSAAVKIFDVANDGTSYDVVIGNTIAGAMGNKGKTFTFKVQITSLIDAGKTYRAVYVGTDTQDKDPVELTANQLEDGITLKDGQQLHIYGVSKGEGYSVTEVEANANGYVTTIDNNGTPIDQGSSGNAATGTVDNGAVTVTFTNTRNAITPTGLVMNVAPYVLLVLVAAGAGYVFLRKREED